ncbi:M28 family peptidase [candidate division KSB1 bacterium]|nr:M28 family peptidase [candidate division KSB1 bacterium]NIR68416.1 M28 family peptidase [candidate division KSB1 bacterium]NIS27093.1 M28 family peptidase [candidate division KSB1 bacterium]NIT73947.1 M28 family peptidase [candidate division KSB1 bacterium]NIU27837.1 M28 family peptidase [candidate division KSB1 bacterium]
MQRCRRAILYLLFVLSFSSLVVPAHAAPGKNNETYDLNLGSIAKRSITPHEAQLHVDILASDKLTGRESGMLGQWLAAKYIADEFSKYGLLHAGDKRGYYQNFQIEHRDLRQARLVLKYTNPIRRDPVEFVLKYDFIPFDFTGEGKFTASVVFAGYGITAPEYDYDDYTAINAKGKIVLVLRHEPQEDDPESIFEGTQLTKHALFEQKARNALRHGAKGLLLVTDPAGRHNNMSPQGSWSYSHPRTNRKRWELALDDHYESFPAIWIDIDVARKLLAPSRSSLNQLQNAIDMGLKPRSFAIRNLKVHMNVDLERKTRQTQNVLGLVKGSDPRLRNELVVVGAHYDHLGIIDNQIYNGADDNASGTAGVLEIAEAFSEIPVVPRRSVLFIAFSAEELGLLGSRYYVEHPVWPLERTVTMINLDMIGRNDPYEVSVIGSNRSPKIHAVNIEANEEVGLDLKYDGEHFFNRSDQANFAKHGIPVLFYNTGVHHDYHRPTDVPEKINPQKLSRIARLAFLVAWEIANSDTRPKYAPFRIH